VERTEPHALVFAAALGSGAGFSIASDAGRVCGCPVPCLDGDDLGVRTRRRLEASALAGSKT
jgi:hypothetical protein